MKLDDPLAEYVGIVHSRRNDPIPDNEYGEIHHIIPRSCGGSNDSWNLVRLAPEEHYRCHALLPQIYTEGREHQSMVFAWRCMKTMGEKVDISEEEYARIKMEYSSCMSEHLKGHVVSEETRRKISEKLKGRPGNRKGSHHSEETKRILAEKSRGNKNCVGRRLSAEQRKRISESLRGNRNRLGGRKHEPY